MADNYNLLLAAQSNPYDQRNCGFADAEALISGIRNVGLNVAKSVPLVSAGNARVDYLQFAGHDPEVVPIAGGRATVYGYQLYPGTAPTVTLWDDGGHSITTFVPERATSDDSFAISISQATLKTYAGRTLLLDIHTHKKKYYFSFIPAGEDSTELKLPLTVPQAYNLKYKVVVTGTYSCTVPQKGTLAPIDIGFRTVLARTARTMVMCALHSCSLELESQTFRSQATTMRVGPI